MWSHLLEEDIRPLYLAPPDFCTQRRVENRLGRSRQTNAFQSTDIPLLVGALDAHTVKFSDLDRGDGWTGQDTPEKSFGSLWRHRLCFRGRTAELKSRAKAALVTLARWEHSFCPVPARQWGLRSASRSSSQCSQALNAKHGWKRWGRFCASNRHAGTRDAMVLRS